MRSRSTAVLAGMTLIVAACSGSVGAECVGELDPAQSVARVWNEAALDAIRRDTPAPPIHARNLFHLSAAMWDAWAAYDSDAVGYFTNEASRAADPTAAREEAISYAAYRVLTHRFAGSPGALQSLAEFDAIMEGLCFPASVANRVGNAPSAVGNRIGHAVIAAGLVDGSNEAGGYAGDYASPNIPLPVAASGTRLVEPNVWQPLFVTVIDEPGGDPVAQGFMVPHWGEVEAFAIDEMHRLDPGPPPRLGDASDAAFKEAAVEVIRMASTLDPASATLVDIGPGAWGDNSLTANDGAGHLLNPVTGRAYDPNLVREGDFGRVLAEYWGDGPEEETPPGHWNILANAVSDDPRLELRVGGTGEPVDRLEWDVKLYFALHDAAIASWWTKQYYDYARPISMIRHMGGLGQSTDPSGTSFHADGLPLVAGLIEVVTDESSAPGERHTHLADAVGAIAVLSWLGPPHGLAEGPAGVGWMLAVDWMPYQEDSFVTPPFPGYVSGHSTFSRAAAEVLTAMTGSAFFPGGIGEWTVPTGILVSDQGPSQPVTLQWATYFDAADQSGISRLYGGIHVRADDFGGRFMGSICGIAAWEAAVRHWS